MKKIVAYILAALLLLAMPGCGQTPAETLLPTNQTTNPTAQATTAPTTVPPTTVPTTPPPTTTVPEPTVPEVTVTFDANEGDASVASMRIPVDGVYGELPTLSRKGYVFLGWFTQQQGGQQIFADMPLVAEADHTLYAQWEVQTEFVITLHAGAGRLSPYNHQLVLKNGDKYGTLPEPIREGYKFLGWYTQEEGGTRIKSTTKFAAGEDQVLYAHWEYNALSYWRFVLENRVQQIPQCRRVVVYLERNAGYKTYIDCPFLTDAGAINPAEVLEEYKVTDAWIREQNPYIIVKLTTDTDMSLISKTAMLRRFPKEDIYIFSTAAVSGNEQTQLYLRLYLAKLLYPEYFEDVDLEVVKTELKVKTTVYH